MYKVSIISIGDELCIGQTINTNASWMSQQIIKTGADVITHSTIRDSRREIVSEIERLGKISDLILVTGGLGPTHDDITKAVLTELFNDELVLNNEVLEYLKAFYKKREREFLERHHQQAMLPSKSKVFENKVGTAPGMLFTNESYSLVSMPGVPREMKYIVNNSVIPFIEQKIKESNASVKVYRTIKTSGIPESALAEKIGDIDFLNGSSLAFLPSYHGVRMRIGTVSDSFENANIELDRVEKIIRSNVEDFVLGTNDIDLYKIVSSKLKESNKTISVAESCTSGMLGEYLTRESGSSSYFLGGIMSYSNESKVNFLNVNENLIESYGAVSEEVAKQMAKNCRKKFGSDYSLSITGVAGPGGGSEEKPVGLVWIGYSDEEKTYAKKYIFTNDREANRQLSCGQAMTILNNELKNEYTGN